MGESSQSMPFMELLLCGVTKGIGLFLFAFPSAGHFLEGRVCWVKPAQSRDFPKIRMMKSAEVSSPQREQR